MSNLVPPSEIERIVGVERDWFKHFARAVSADSTVYILHPYSCLASVSDLRDCMFSLALDCGIHAERWYEDIPVQVGIENGQLVPVDVD